MSLPMECPSDEEYTRVLNENARLTAEVERLRVAIRQLLHEGLHPAQRRIAESALEQRGAK